jgi:hypothetical protein
MTRRSTVRRDEEDWPRRSREPSGHLGLILGLSGVGLVLVVLTAVLAVGVAQGWFRKPAGGLGTPPEPLPADRNQLAGCWPALDPLRGAPVKPGFDTTTMEKLKPGMTLEQVEALVGARGRLLSAEELDQHCQADGGLAAMRLIGPNTACYFWSNGIARMYVFFEGGTYRKGWYRR